MPIIKPFADKAFSCYKKKQVYVFVHLPVRKRTLVVLQVSAYEHIFKNSLLLKPLLQHKSATQQKLHAYHTVRLIKIVFFISTSSHFHISTFPHSSFSNCRIFKLSNSSIPFSNSLQGWITLLLLPGN